jgi:hypothetical protein
MPTSQVLINFVNSRIYDYAIYTMISSGSVGFVAPVGDRQRFSGHTPLCQESYFPEPRNIINIG